MVGAEKVPGRKAGAKLETAARNLNLHEFVADLAIKTGRSRAELISEPYGWLLILDERIRRAEAKESLRELAVIGAAVAPMASSENADGTRALRRELENQAYG